MEVDKTVFMKIMKDLGAAGIASCCLQGCGESFMNPHSVEAIVTGKASGPDMAVITNGVLFTEDKAVECLPHLGWMRFSALMKDKPLHVNFL
jgi:GTP 3',8-cyclase